VRRRGGTHAHRRSSLPPHLHLNCGAAEDGTGRKDWTDPTTCHALRIPLHAAYTFRHPLLRRHHYLPLPLPLLGRTGVLQRPHTAARTYCPVLYMAILRLDVTRANAAFLLWPFLD